MPELSGIPGIGNCRERAPDQSLASSPEKGRVFAGAALPGGTWAHGSVGRGLWEVPRKRGVRGHCRGMAQSVALLKEKPWWPPSPLESRSVDPLESTCLLPPTLTFRT